jgi:hypothetical protein
VVPFERVAAREEISAAVAKGDPQQVSAVTSTGMVSLWRLKLEVFPHLELGVGTEPALDLANRSTCPVGLRGRCLVLTSKIFGILKRSSCCCCCCCIALAMWRTCSEQVPSLLPHSPVHPQLLLLTPVGNLGPSKSLWLLPCARVASLASRLTGFTINTVSGILATGLWRASHGCAAHLPCRP